jgi:hypothetical protein
MVRVLVVDDHGLPNSCYGVWVRHSTQRPNNNQKNGKEKNDNDKRTIVGHADRFLSPKADGPGVPSSATRLTSSALPLANDRHSLATDIFSAIWEFLVSGCSAVWTTERAS